MTHALPLSPAKLWRDVPRDTLIFGAIAVAACAALAGTAISTPSLSDLGFGAATPAEAPPTPPPLLVRPLAPEAALSINRKIPLAQAPNPFARPFVWQGANPAAKARALDCLTSAVYYEAGSEPTDGQKAVAQVVLNRVRHPAFPSTVCDVVYQGSTRATGCQFTFTCDGSLARRPSADGWARARAVAQAALAGSVYAPAGYATHYHADYVVPYWASSLAKNAVVGAHIFYRWAGGWGQPAAFDKSYAGREPNSQALRAAALAAVAARPAVPSSTAQSIAAIPGAELTKAPGGRLSVRFKVAARKAADEAPHNAYVDTFKASDNLRWTLSGGGAEAEEKPLGLATAPVAGGGGSGAPQR